MLPHAISVTHTRAVRLGIFFLCLPALLGCVGCGERNEKDEAARRAAGDSTPEADEPSPNARILPEPLESGVPAVEDESADEPKNRPAIEPREEAKPFPVNQALVDDPLKKGPGAGVEMEFQIAWPEGRRSVTVGKETYDTWPRLRIQLLREIPSRPARMRWVLEGRAFPFPDKTEIRARADRIGHLILWPNGRSYRIAPTGSLHALFADRRVDRMPFVEADKVEKGVGTRLGKPTTRLVFTTPVGKGTMEFVEESDLPFASEMLCAAFLEILRVKPTKELCPRFHLPVHFEVEWPNGETVVFSVLSWGAAGSFELNDFRMPPELPIHKPGELPPFEDYFLDEATRSSLLPLTKDKAAPAPPALPASPGNQPSPAPGTPPSAPPPGPPKNQVVLQNKLSRPLVVFLNKVPYAWLTPGAVKEIYLTSPDLRVAARDFLGEMVFAERTLLAPAQLHFGEAGDDGATAAPPPQ